MVPPRIRPKSARENGNQATGSHRLRLATLQVHVREHLLSPRDATEPEWKRCRLTQISPLVPPSFPEAVLGGSSMCWLSQRKRYALLDRRLDTTRD